MSEGRTCRRCGCEMGHDGNAKCFVCLVHERAAALLPLTDEQALAEMAAWLKGANADSGWKHLEIDNDPSSLEHFSISLVQERGSPPHVILSGTGKAIAEAWAALRLQEGWPA